MMTGFKKIGITFPEEWPDVREEAGQITRFLESGALDLMHIRKPDSSLEYTRRLVSLIPERLQKHLVVHSHYGLAREFEFGGIHCKGEIKPADWPGMKIKSRSCHSIDEVASVDSQLFQYSFLSPIYDSISKQGYKAKHFLGSDTLLNLTARYPVIALGGVTPQKFPELIGAKFAGAALLGYLWSQNEPIEEKIEKIKRYVTVYHQ